MQYRIWWSTISGYLKEYSNFSKPFYYPVESIEQAKFALNLLAEYDLRNDLVSDNMSGLEFRENDLEEWQEWENKDGYDIWTVIDES